MASTTARHSGRCALLGVLRAKRRSVLWSPQHERRSHAEELGSEEDEDEVRAILVTLSLVLALDAADKVGNEFLKCPAVKDHWRWQHR